MAEQEQENWVTMCDEEGKEHKFFLMDTLELDGKEYALMVPEEEMEREDDEADEIVIFRLDKEGDEEVLVMVDEEEFEKVCEAYYEVAEDE
jgi:uncharacterized protein YrzB (UPF0473 family)